MSRLSGGRAHRAKQRRAWALVGGLAGLALVGAFLVLALGERALYFHTPADLAERPVEAGKPFRLGGLVAADSVRDLGNAETLFAVEDGAAVLAVRYKGVLPDLFREGQGVVAEGALNPQGVFIASRVLAKHDENYMPAEVAKALKERGEWQPKTSERVEPGQ